MFSIRQSLEWWFDYFPKGNSNSENTRGKPGIEKSMKSWWFDYFSKGKLKQGKHPWKNQELRNPWKVDDLTTFQKESLKGKTPVEKPGIEKSMKSCWFDYFSKGKLNRGNTRGKTKNCIFHTKLMIWLCFSKGKLNRENTRGKPGIEKSMKSWWFDYFSKGKLKQGKHPWKNQELRNPWKVDELTTFQKES